MKDYFTINNFHEGLCMGREIEFLFDGDMYFIQTDFKFMRSHSPIQSVNDKRYVLYKLANWYDNDAEKILSGTYDEIISFPLKGNMNIKTDFDKFELHCML